MKLFKKIFLIGGSLISLILYSGCKAGPQAESENGKFAQNIPVNKSRLINDVKFLTELKPARSIENLDSLNKAADYIKKEFEKLGLKAEEQKFELNGIEYKNIIVSFGADFTERIIVGAHYDVAGEQDGADDNASGVAGLLEIARLLNSEKPRLKNRIDLVAFTLEEPPVFGTDKMGSAIHAKSLHDKQVKVKTMFSLEMIGYFSDQENSQRYPVDALKYLYPSVGNFIGLVGRTDQEKIVKDIKTLMHKGSTIDIQSINAPASIEGIDFSDHRNYWTYGYNAVMITDTSFFRNPNYHMASDKIETLNFDKMSDVVKSVYWAVINL